MTLSPNERFVLLIYDIPQTSKLRNPSGLLRRFAARINLSCWVAPLKNVALLPLKEWIESGAIVEVVQFDENEREKVIDLARRAIIRDVEEMREYVNVHVRSVRKKFDAVSNLASGSDDREKAWKKAEHFAYLGLYRAKKLAEAAEEAALHFDLTGDVASVVEALRGTIKARAAIYFSLSRKARGEATLPLPLERTA